MALKPVADRVIVKYFETEDKTASGIVLPDSSKEKTQQARDLLIIFFIQRIRRIQELY